MQELWKRQAGGLPSWLLLAVAYLLRDSRLDVLKDVPF